MVKKRYNGIDVLKILGVFLVCVLHFYLNYGYSNVKITGYINILEIAIRYIAFSCIGIFVMCSGYLLSNKKPTKKYFLGVLKFFFVYAFIYSIFYFGTHKLHSMSFVDFFGQLLSMNTGYFWYVQFYICLYLLIPYLNMIIKKLDKKQFLYFIGILIFITALPIYMESVPPLETLKIIRVPRIAICLWPATFYFIGAYFKKFNPKFSKRKTAFILICTLVFIACLSFTYSKGGSAKFVGSGKYGNLISVIITTCIFNIFYNINIKNFLSKCFEFCASFTYEIYLCLCISDIFTRKIMNTLVKSGTFQYRYILIEPIINFAIAFVFGMLAHYLIKLIVKVFDLKSSKKATV